MPGFQLLILAGGALVTLLLFVAAFSGPSTARAQAKRLESVRERHSKSSEVAAQAQMKRLFAARQSSAESLAQRFIPNPALLRLRLEQTGRTWTLGHYAMACAGIVLLVGALLLLRGIPALLALPLALFAGIGLPHFVVGILIKRRINKFTARFPDAIELMVRGLRSGLPISETIGVVAQELGDPVGTEFRNVSDKMKIGRTMEAALQDVADRLGTPEFQFFVISLQIQRETGGNLAETLSNLADVLRKRAAMKLKIRAMSSESKASAYIIGALPFVVFGLIWTINSSYMQGFFIDTRLMITGAGAVVWMGIGAFIMAKMINFEI
ncbi:type II secretion system F family protein [Sphingosinicella sp. LHD-64]|uniref:type II secretion system F family protein n=1 Tax=Sphingosinicella sp. LHD-64 TaxID=3072139 RepID=UPI00280C815D|nr:type II secretion system F family protein [Sphingosinicella sp. LHD-64]MDQ8755395.1 type II secretion system F family protein [Sphingosinicella sp. LHD-64]